MLSRNKVRELTWTFGGVVLFAMLPASFASADEAQAIPAPAGLHASSASADAPQAIPNPVVASDSGRTMTLSDVSLSGGGNVTYQRPGASVEISFSWTYAQNNPYCPTCDVYWSYGIDGVFNTCFSSGALPPPSGRSSTTFTVPQQVGVYVISWDMQMQRECMGSHPRNSSRAIGLVIVGSFNTTTGELALASVTTGVENTADGYSALTSNTTGKRNVAVGFLALQSNVGPQSAEDKSGTSNTGIGWQALRQNTRGLQNTAVGESALTSNVTGSHNTGIGEDVLFKTNSNFNAAIGESALYENVSGTNNVAHGYFSLNRSTGTNNIALGSQSGCNLSAGDGNIYIGSVGPTTPGRESGVIRIGLTTATQLACGASNLLPAQTRAYIAGIYPSGVSGRPVFVTSSGQLGVKTSARRFKEDIASISSADDRILKLRPVLFRYRDADTSGEKPLEFGLIAEEVAEVMPELVQRDSSGQPYTVNYEFLAPLLLSAAQRQHGEMQQQREMLTALHEENEALRRELAALSRAVAAFTRGSVPGDVARTSAVPPPASSEMADRR